MLGDIADERGYSGKSSYVVSVSTISLAIEMPSKKMAGVEPHGERPRNGPLRSVHHTALRLRVHSPPTRRLSATAVTP